MYLILNQDSIRSLQQAPPQTRHPSLNASNVCIAIHHFSAKMITAGHIRRSNRRTSSLAHTCRRLPGLMEEIQVLWDLDGSLLWWDAEVIDIGSGTSCQDAKLRYAARNRFDSMDYSVRFTDYHCSVKRLQHTSPALSSLSLWKYPEENVEQSQCDKLCLPRSTKLRNNANASSEHHAGINRLAVSSTRCRRRSARTSRSQGSVNSFLSKVNNDDILLQKDEAVLDVISKSALPHESTGIDETTVQSSEGNELQAERTEKYVNTASLESKILFVT